MRAIKVVVHGRPPVGQAVQTHLRAGNVDENDKDAVIAALEQMLGALGAMHMALRSLDPGGSMLLVRPLLKPLNRLELEIAGGLLRLVEKLQVGDGT